MRRKLLAIVAALAMVMTMIPAMAFATDTTQIPAGSVAEVNGNYYSNLDAALNAAQENDTVNMICDVTYTGSTATYGGKALAIEKKITLDLNQHKLTTEVSREGIRANNNCSIINGTIEHTGGIAAIKAWKVAKFENLNIIVTKTTSTVGGIVIQENPANRIESIKNVTITGATNGIETYNCGDAPQDVIGVMENVNVEATDTGLLLSAPCGIAKNCTIKAGKIGINLFRKGKYNATLELDKCTVTGGIAAIYVHDENFADKGKTNIGKLELIVDPDSELTSENGSAAVQTEIGMPENNSIAVGNKDGICVITNENGKVEYFENHKYGTEVLFDENGHYTECACGDINYVSDHEFKWVIDKAATETAKGSKHEECTACEYKKASVEIPMITKQQNGETTVNETETGDASDMTVPMALAGLAAAAMAAAVFARRRSCK